MQNKAQMTIGKLSLMLVGLTIIWIMCSRAELEFQKRFQDDLISRMGGHSIPQSKIQLAQAIKSNETKDSYQSAVKLMDQIFSKTYNLLQQEQLFCILIRDFDTQQNLDKDYDTIRSILQQQYKNYHLIYLSEEGDNSVEKIQSYLTSNQILEERRDFITAKADTIEALFKASEKCPQGGIMLILENEQKLISPSALKVINSQFTESVDLTWATSLYSNNKLGFSFGISDAIKQKKDFRKYPLPMNDVIAFRNSLFVKNRSSFIDHRVYYPLYMTESYGFTFMRDARDFRYIPEILSIKNKKAKIRVQRSDLEKELQEMIRKDESIIPLLKTLTNRP